MPESSKSSRASQPQPRSAHTRATILAAAERIFARSGFAGARTDAIAAAAGVNKALLYYYFKSKNALYQAVIEDHFLAFHEKAMEVLTADGSAREILLRYVNVHFDFITSRHRYASLYQQLMLNGDKLWESLVRKYFQPRSHAMGELLARGMRDGEFRRIDVRHTAISIVGLIVFYFSSSRVMKILGFEDAFTDENLKARKDAVLDFIRHAVFSDPSAPIETT